jgi:hypothetical protein
MAQEMGMGIDAPVSVSFHPEVVASLDEYDYDMKGELQQAVAAFTTLSEDVGIGDYIEGEAWVAAAKASGANVVALPQRA